jgi:hypothetical protein
MRNTCDILIWKSKCSTQLENSRPMWWRIIQKWALKKHGGSDSTGPKYRKGARFCRHGNKPSVSMKNMDFCLTVWEINNNTRSLLHVLEQNEVNKNCVSDGVIYNMRYNIQDVSNRLVQNSGVNSPHQKKKKKYYMNICQ